MATITNSIRWATNTDEMIKEMQQGLETFKVTRESVEKLVEALSGDKLIAAAHKWAAAVTEIGGATKLNSDEQERFSTILDKTVAKLEATGQKVPAIFKAYQSELADLAKAHADASKHADDHATILQKLGQIIQLEIPGVSSFTKEFNDQVAVLGALGVAAGATFVGYELIKKGIEGLSAVSERARDFRNLSIATGVSAQELQILSNATSDYGVTTEQLGNGIFQLARRVALDDTSARNAFVQLGLSMDDFKNSRPIDTFIAVIDKMNKMRDETQRNLVAAELFGSRFGRALLSIPDLIEKIKDATHDTASVMNNEAIAKASEFADSIDHLKTEAEALAGTLLSPLLGNLGNLIEALRTGKIEAGSFAEALKNFFKAGAGGPDVFGIPLLPSSIGGAASIFGSTKGTKAVAATEVTVPQGPEDKVNSQLELRQRMLADFQKQIGTVDDATKKFLGDVSGLGTEFLTPQRLAGAGVTPAQIEAWKKGLALQQELITARSQAAKANAEADALESGQAQNSIAVRIAGLDAEHAARKRIIALTVEDNQKKGTQLLAEDIKYQADRHLLEAEGDAKDRELRATSEAELAKITASNRTLTIQEQLDAIDRETMETRTKLAEQTGAYKDAGDLDYIQIQIGEAKKQKLIDESNKKQATAVRKLEDEIASINEETDRKGLDRILANENAKIKLEKDAVLASTATEEQKQVQLDLIDKKGEALRRRDAIDFEKSLNAEILKVDEQTEDARLQLTESGMQLELDQLELRRQRKIAELKLEGKATAAMIDAENGLYDSQRDLIIARYDPIRKAWMALNTDLRQTWADTWLKALEGTGSFVDALLSPFTQLEHEWLALLAAMVADWEGQFLARLGINLPGVTPQGAGVGGAAGGLNNLTKVFGPSKAEAAATTGEGPGFVPGSEGTFNAEGDFVPGTPVGAGTAVGFGLLGSVGEDIAAAKGTATKGSIFMGAGESAALTGGLAASLGASAATSVALGAVTFGIGAAVPFIIMGLKKLFSHDISADIARDAGTRFGTAFSKATIDAIQSDVKLGDAGVKALKDQLAVTTNAADRATLQADIARKGMTEMASEQLHLTSIIKDAGGVTLNNVTTLTARLRDTFVLLSTHELTTIQATQILDENFQSFIASSTDGLGLVSKQLNDIVQLDKSFGTNSQAVAAFRQAQGTNITQGFAKESAGFTSPIQALIDQANSADAALEGGIKGLGNSMTKAGTYTTGLIEKIAKLQAQIATLEGKSSLSPSQQADLEAYRRELQTLNAEFDGLTKGQATASDALDKAVVNAQEDFTRQGKLLDLAFQGARADGETYEQILTELGPSIDNLAKLQEELGLQADASFQHLIDVRKVLSTHQELAASFDGLQQLTVGLANSNFITQDSFNLLGDEAAAELRRAKDAGLSDDDTFQLMQKSLQTLYELQKRFNLTLDEPTKKLLDQAEADGYVGDQFESAQDKMQHSADTTNQLLGAIADALGAKIPEGAQKAVDALNKIPKHVNTDVNTNYTSTGSNAPPPPSGGGGTSTPGPGPEPTAPGPSGGGDTGATTVATGGRVVPGGIERFPAYYRRGGVVRTPMYASEGGQAPLAPPLLASGMAEGGIVPLAAYYEAGGPVRPWSPERPDKPPVRAASGGRVSVTGIDPFVLASYYAGGGFVSFVPQGTDTVPAMLTPGEVVLTVDQQEAVSNTLHAALAQAAAALQAAAMQAGVTGQLGATLLSGFAALAGAISDSVAHAGPIATAPIPTGGISWPRPPTMQPLPPGGFGYGPDVPNVPFPPTMQPLPPGGIGYGPTPAPPTSTRPARFVSTAGPAESAPLGFAEGGVVPEITTAAGTSMSRPIGFEYGGIVQAFAEGGLVPPAMILHTGEPPIQMAGGGMVPLYAEAGAIVPESLRAISYGPSTVAGDLGSATRTRPVMIHEGDTHVTVHASAVDATGLKRLTERPGGLADMIVESITKDKRGRGVAIKQFTRTNNG